MLALADVQAAASAAQSTDEVLTDCEMLLDVIPVNIEAKPEMLSPDPDLSRLSCMSLLVQPLSSKTKIADKPMPKRN